MIHRLYWMYCLMCSYAALRNKLIYCFTRVINAEWENNFPARFLKYISMLFRLTMLITTDEISRDDGFFQLVAEVDVIRDGLLPYWHVILRPNMASETKDLSSGKIHYCLLCITVSTDPAGGSVQLVLVCPYHTTLSILTTCEYIWNSVSTRQHCKT